MIKKFFISILVIGFTIGAIGGLQLIHNTNIVEADNVKVDKIINNNLIPSNKNTNWIEKLADSIIIGQVSEDQFREMNLTSGQVFKVFKQISTKRGWKFSDAELERLINVALTSDSKKSDGVIQPLYSGTCSQKLEEANGSNYATFPYGQTSPNGNECGDDPDDIVLLYNTPNAPNTNADNVRWYSVVWWVRWVISGCYSYSGGLSANGLCSNQTRVCIGSCGQALGSDLSYLYIWQQ